MIGVLNSSFETKSFIHVAHKSMLNAIHVMFNGNHTNVNYELRITQI